MKSILVIGMGRFGIQLATKFTELGNEVMIVDQDENIINELSSKFTDSLVGDCTKESTINFIGVNSFDACFVTIGSGFQETLEIVCLLKDAGAKYIVAKAAKESQEKFLKLVGANEVCYPERDMASRMAYSFTTELSDLVDFSDDFSIAEVEVPKEWYGKTLIEVDCRKRYHVNILALKNNDGKTMTYIAGDTVFNSDSSMIVTGDKEALVKFAKKKRFKL